MLGRQRAEGGEGRGVHRSSDAWREKGEIRPERESGEKDADVTDES
jgi:hypothetical protein